MTWTALLLTVGLFVAVMLMLLAGIGWLFQDDKEDI